MLNSPSILLLFKYYFLFCTAFLLAPHTKADLCTPTGLRILFEEPHLNLSSILVMQTLLSNK